LSPSSETFVRSDGVVVAGLFTGVAGNGTAWHGNDVVGSSAVVVVTPAAAVVDGAVDDSVLGDVDTEELPPQAASNNAAQHPSTAANRIGPS
jgi:hypothetical protein